MKLALLTALVLRFACGATYYVANAGSDGNAGTSTAAPWATLAKVNSSSFTAGDQILLNRGDTWHEGIQFPSSGAANNPITVDAYGLGVNAAPLIVGADRMTVWTASGSNYTTPLTIATKQVFVDGVRLATAASVVAMATGTFFDDAPNNLLYVRMADGSSPTLHVVEVSQRDQGIFVGSKSHLAFKNLQLVKHNFEGYFSQGVTDDVLMDSLIVQWNYIAGIGNYNGSDATFHTNGVIIRLCDVSYNGGTGIAIGTRNDSWVVERNRVHDNAILAVDGNQLFTAGIRTAADRLETNITIQDNTVYNNGLGNTGDRGAGIWIDTSGAGVVVRRNTIYNNHTAGLMLELDTAGTVAYQNIIYGQTISETVNAVYGYGILVQRGCSGAKVFNNLSYGNRIGLTVLGDFPAAAGNMVNNLFQNNIIAASIARAFSARYGAENDGVNGSGNIYTYNSFGPEASNFVEWGASNNLATYSTFATAYGSATHAITGTPTFGNAAALDFSPLAGSPVIDAGIPVGLSIDYIGLAVPQGSAPELGPYEVGRTSPGLRRAAVRGNASLK